MCVYGTSVLLGVEFTRPHFMQPRVTLLCNVYVYASTGEEVLH